MVQDTSKIKKRIIQTLEQKGPSLPVHISSSIGQSSLFTSAFLSELLAEKRIKTSHMRVGSSPLYFLSGQESQLEKFQDNIKGKEKEALILLKEKNFLKDSKLLAPIRVALRSIKDFAIPIQKENELYWKYFTINEQDFENQEKPLQEEKAGEQSLEERKKEPKQETNNQENEKTSKETESKDEETKKEVKSKDEEYPKEHISTEKEKQDLDIFDKQKQETKKENAKKKTKKKKISKKKTSQKNNDKLFNKTKEFLASKEIELIDIESIGQKDLVLRIRENNQEKILIALDKKTFGEKELLDVHKKASNYGLNYIILKVGEPTKKISNLIEAAQKLSRIEKFE